jgi:hypothetical protein
MGQILPLQLVFPVERILSVLHSMFVERRVCYSALFTNLVWWHASAVSFPLSDVILAQLT